ncbi:MAG TPA: alkaline phosphatase family protein [Longimicrobiales bacterium]|nr:alkaline phosphatase family protein [Longimicrobiales bacterium]
MTAPFRRVVLVGLDGFDPGLVEALWGRGELPRLARLRDAGGACRIRTTATAQTPVAWSTVATGRNPGAHGVFDFLGRDPETYTPDVALFRYERRSAFLPPKVVTGRRAPAVWTWLNRAGIPTTILRFPVTYGEDPVDGRLLAGVGVPDIRGGFGTSTVFRTSEVPGVGGQAAPAGEGAGETVQHGASGSGEGRVEARLEPHGADSWRGVLPGPLAGTERAGVELTLTRTPDGGQVAIGRETVLLVPGEWGRWLPVRFKTGRLQSARGQVRFVLVRGGQAPVLYASPVHFDPAAPPHPISHPWEYAGDLARDMGPYHTLGMAEEHQGLSGGQLDEGLFHDQCASVLEERRTMLLRELDRAREGLVACVFDTPDRLQHMFWRFREPDHPANRVHGFDPVWQDAVEAHYRRCDEVVGEVLEATGPEDLVLVVSDHGFGTFRSSLHLNALLRQAGLLHLRGDAPGGRDLLADVDWDRTRAYALGMSGVYLNLREREGNGIVPPGEVDTVTAELCRVLEGYADPETGASPIRWARPASGVYRGPWVGEAPDVLVGCTPGTRISPETAMGGAPERVMEPNTRRWAGDHVVDPDAVPGILVCGAPFRQDPVPSLTDVAPTILSALGVPVPPEVEGRSLLP